MIVLLSLAFSWNQSQTPEVLGLRLDESGWIWPPYEVFRIANRKIVERRYDRVHFSAQTFQSVPYDYAMPTDRTLYASAEPVPPGYLGSRQTGNMPQIIHVLAGEVQVELVGAYERLNEQGLFLIDANFDRSRVAGVRAVRVSAGAIVIIPPSSIHVLTNATTRKASIVRLDLLPEVDETGDVVWPNTPAEIDAAAVGLGRMLLQIETKAFSENAHIEFGLLTVPSGARLPIAKSSRLLILTSYSNTLTVVNDLAGLEETVQIADDSAFLHSTANDLNVLVPRALTKAFLVNSGSDPITVQVIAVIDPDA